MENKLKPVLERLTVLAALFVAAASPAHGSDVGYQAVMDWLGRNADAPADGLAPGLYGHNQVAALARYIPPGYLAYFDFPALKLVIDETRHYQPHRLYQDATARYVDKANLDYRGNLEGYTAGMPFSHTAIDAAGADDAGSMVAWNHVHRWQFFGWKSQGVIAFMSPATGGSTGELLPGMEGSGRLDRSLTMYYHQVYLSKLAALPEQHYRLDVDGSEEILFKELIELKAPFNIAGTKIIVERPLDQSKGDLVNSYLPSERRVRRLSAKQRADSWMGTHWTLDDFLGYSGLVMDNTWRYLGRKVVAYVASSVEATARFHGPMNVVPLDHWQLRPCFVVEAVPRWEGHPYGRRMLFIDQETYSIAMVLAFDRNDSLLKVFTVGYEHSEGAVDPDPSMTTPRPRSSVAIDLASGTANVSIMDLPTEYVAVKPSQVRRIFSVSTLAGGR